MIVGEGSVALARNGSYVVLGEGIVVCHLNKDRKGVEICGHLLWIDKVIEPVLRLIGGRE